MEQPSVSCGQPGCLLPAAAVAGPPSLACWGRAGACCLGLLLWLGRKLDGWRALPASQAWLVPAPQADRGSPRLPAAIMLCSLDYLELYYRALKRN